MRNTAALFGRGNSHGFALVRQGLLSRGLIRAQADGAKSTALAADGLSLVEFSADLARFDGVTRDLMIEGQRTNSIRNARAQGAVVGVVGSGGALPTFTSIANNGGLSTEVIGTFVVNGVTVTRLRLFGTASGSTYAFDFETSTAILAEPLQTWTSSFYFREFSAIVAPNNYRHRIVGRTVAGATVVGNAFTTATFSPTTALQRQEKSETLTDDATLARISSGFQLGLTASTFYDFMIDIGPLQMEQAPFASSVILPASGAPAASTRGTDILNFSLASLGISGAFALFWSGVLNQAPVTGTNQFLFQADAGDNSNVYRALNFGASLSIRGGRVTGGASTSLTLGDMTAGSAFKIGMALNGAGRAAFSLNGEAIQATTGGPTGLTTVRLGNNSILNSPMFGKTKAFIIVPGLLSDGMVRAFTTTLPA